MAVHEMGVIPEEGGRDVGFEFYRLPRGFFFPLLLCLLYTFELKKL